MLCKISGTLSNNYISRDVRYDTQFFHEYTDGCSAQYKLRHWMGSHILLSQKDFGYKTREINLRPLMLKVSKMLLGPKSNKELMRPLFNEHLIFLSFYPNMSQNQLVTKLS